MSKTKVRIDPDALMQIVNPYTAPFSDDEIEIGLARSLEHIACSRHVSSVPTQGARWQRQQWAGRRVKLVGGLTAAAGAAAFGLVNVLPLSGTSAGVGEAWAKRVIARVVAVAVPSTGILHVDAISSGTISTGNDAGQPIGPTSLEVNSWDEQDPPHSFWATVSTNNSIDSYTTVVDGQVTRYDPVNDTLSSGPEGTLPPSAVDPALAAVHAVAGATDPSDAATYDTSDSTASVPSMIEKLVDAPGVKVNSGASVDGSPAIAIISADGKTTLYVAPRTYQPIELVDGSVNPTVTETTRFKTYEVLPDGSVPVPNLRPEHPNAKP